ncbi:MAG TPA: M12 family metallo-peptidase [Gammaproteobacteria bacterium]|nr:M12 family metallo-peptidase [Gammaproteobacteria bacterium]
MRICLLGLVCVLGSFTAQAGELVFRDAPATTRQALAAVQNITDAPETRDAAVETVHFNSALFDARAGDVFELPLGPGYRVITQKVIAHPGHVATWIGKLADQRVPYSLTLTRAASGVVAGRISLPGQVWEVRPGDPTVSLLVNYAWRPRPLSDDSRQPPFVPRQPVNGYQRRSTEAVTGSTGGHATIDVLIAYSPGVAASHAGSALSAYLNNLVDAANTAYLNSGIDLTLRLAGSVEVRFGDGMSADQLLDCVSGADTGSAYGCRKDDVRLIRSMRAIDAADLVMMIAKTTGDAVAGTAGIAYEGGAGHCGAHPYCFSADYAYAAMLIGFRDTSTFTHEIGHTLGAGHDINAPDHDGAFSYSHGHLFGGDDGTVMAYADNQNLIFSSPDYACGGDPCGNDQTENNAYTIKQTKEIIAAFSDRIPEIKQRGTAAPGAEAEFNLAGSDAGSGGGVVGPTAAVQLLENGEPAGMLDYSVPLDGSIIKLTLPANLRPGAEYALEFAPTYRSGFTFQTPLQLSYRAPEVTSFSADRIGQTQATLHAAVKPFGLDTTLELSANNSAILPPGPAVAVAPTGSDTNAVVDRALTLDGLRCNTRYVVYLRAGNAAGVTTSNTAFQTLSCTGTAPTIQGVQPGRSDSHSQMLTVQGSDDTSQAAFAIQYGEQGWFAGGESDWQAMSSSGSASFELQNLACGTTYQYRAIAYSSTGGAHGSPATFTTAPCQPGTLSISGDTEINAGAGTATYTIARNGGSDGRITIDFAAVGGQAKVNREFLQTTGTLVLEDGQTKATVSVPLLLSAGNNGGYDYRLALSNPTGGATLAAAAGVRTVIQYPAQLGPRSGGVPSPSASGGTANDVSSGKGGAGGLGFIVLAALSGLALARRVTFP